MSTTKYEHVRIPVLKKTDFSTWKIKMLMFLEATDPDYIDRINDGPHEPRKLVPSAVVDGVEIPEHYVAKDKFEWTAEEKADVLKDAKVRNILHNSLDEVLSNRVITCKTAKEIWDALEVQCQGTVAIKKNRRTLLIQEYEQFEAKADESLTEVYDRFLSLLNELSLVGKVYDNDDSNTKFLRALTEDWDTQTSILRHHYDLNEISLDEVYGMLKTHDMELQQRKYRKSSRNKGVALKVDSRSSGSTKGKAKQASYPDESSNTDDDVESNTDGSNADESSSDEDIQEMVALLVKGFKKFKYRKQQKMFNSAKKSSRSGEKKEKDSKTEKLDKSKVRCYNCDGMGHFANECKKAKKKPGKALITGNTDWMDSDSEEEEVRYALMANADEPTTSTSEKVHTPNYNCDLNSVSELRSFLNSLHTSFRSQTLENTRLINEVSELRKRNDHLESELIFLLEIKKDCEKAKHNEQIQIQKCTYLQGQLEKERETLKIWTDSGKRTQEILGGGNWKTGLGYVDKKEASETEEIKKKNDYTKPVKFMKESNVKFTYKKKSFPTTEKNANPDASANPDVDAIPEKKNEQTIDRLSRKNIGLLSKSQLNKKLSKITGLSDKKGPKRNRNGKQGIDKRNGYKMNPDAPRKRCYKCGNTNHLALDCRKQIRKKTEIPSSDKGGRSVNFKPDSPCSHCGSKWHTIYVCTAYHSLYQDNYEPLPKFYKGTNYDKKKISQVYKQVNPIAKSTTDGTNPDSVKTDEIIPDAADLKSKTSAANKINIKHVKRVQQVWILKNPN